MRLPNIAYTVQHAPPVLCRVSRARGRRPRQLCNAPSRGHHGAAVRVTEPEIMFTIRKFEPKAHGEILHAGSQLLYGTSSSAHRCPVVVRGMHAADRTTKKTQKNHNCYRNPRALVISSIAYDGTARSLGRRCFS